MGQANSVVHSKQSCLIELNISNKEIIFTDTGKCYTFDDNTHNTHIQAFETYLTYFTNNKYVVHKTTIGGLTTRIMIAQNVSEHSVSGCTMSCCTVSDSDTSDTNIHQISIHVIDASHVHIQFVYGIFIHLYASIKK